MNTQTEVQMQHWLRSTLGEVATIERRAVEAAEICDGTIYVGLENIETGGNFVNVSTVASGELSSNKFVFTKDHILYGKLRPYLAKIARPDFDGICSTDILPILPGSGISRDYLTQFLRLPAMIQLANSRATGANLPRVNPKELAAFEIPVPSLADQLRIATLLDKVESLRAKRREAVAQLGKLTQSIFVDMFGHPVLNPHGLPPTRLGDVGRLDRGVSKHRPRNAPDLLGGPYPLVQTGDVANCDGYIRSYVSSYSERGLKQSRMWPAGTLCITIAANIAKTGILTFDACFPDSVVGFTSEDSATVGFVRSWLSFIQRHLEDNAPKSAQRNINLAILRNLEVPLPSLELRRKFAQCVERVEQVKVSQRAHLTELDALFASLQYRAFRGEL